MSSNRQPKYCPRCGAILYRNRQGVVYCNNRECPAFGQSVKLLVESNSVTVAESQEENEPFTVSSRQLISLLDTLSSTKNPPTDLFGDIQRASKHYINDVTDALKLKVEIAKNLPDIPSKAQSLETLNQIAYLLIDKQTVALTINTLATEAVLNDLTRLTLLETAIIQNTQLNRLLKAEKQSPDTELSEVEKA